MLNKYIQVYIPGTRNGSIPLTQDEILKVNTWAAKKLSSQFGGCTAQAGVGSWQDDNGILITENVTLIKAYHDRDPIAAWDIGVKIAQVLKRALRQYAVTLESQDGIDFI